jgi:competence protein ComEC
MNSVPHVIARQGMMIMLDSVHQVYFQVLYPDHDVSHLKNTNDASIVGQLVYGNERFMLTGDAPVAIESRIMSEISATDLQTTVLKLGHHGSKYSTSNAWLDVLKPLYAVVSAGAHNSYGHPNKEMVDRVNAHAIPILATGTLGNIVFETVGVTFQHN